MSDEFDTNVLLHMTFFTLGLSTDTCTDTVEGRLSTSKILVFSIHVNKSAVIDLDLGKRYTRTGHSLHPCVQQCVRTFPVSCVQPYA